MMTWKFIKYTVSSVFLSILLTGCMQSDYTKLVKSELAKGIRKDSVLLGIHFKDTRNEFYGKCFDLNKQHLITEGEGFSVQYLFVDSLSHDQPTPMRLLFVPAFDDNEMLSNMDMKFNYVNWAPWDKHHQSDSLQLKVMDILMRWYGGNKFIVVDIKGNKIPIKLDGNRRLMIYKNDAQSVVVRVQDILHPKFMHSITADELKKD
jgi:hypothetical protein